MKHDLLASFIVFLIAIPLSLGIRAGVGRARPGGPDRRRVGGIVVGLVGGSPLQVSAPRPA
jgi:carbonic anhydrase